MRLHLLYQPILHVNVCIEGLVIINYFTTFDQKTIALQQKKHNTRHNYSVGELTVCSVTPEMKEEGRQQPLHYSPAHVKIQVNCCTFKWQDKMFYFIWKAFHHTDDQKKKKKSEGGRRWVPVVLSALAASLLPAACHHHLQQQH